MFSVARSKSIPILLIIFLVFGGPIYASKPHVINFRSPNLYPESLAWDPTAQHFVVGSLRQPTLFSVSDAGVVDTLLSDDSLPPNSSFLGVSVDSHNRRILAVVHSVYDPSAGSALAAYDFRSPHRRIFLVPLPDPASTNYAAGANDVAVDFSGNAYVTNSASNIIWKVDRDGNRSIFSKSAAFTGHPVEPDTPYSSCGLNGVVYNSKGYLLVVQSNTGKLYRIDADDGSARVVLLNKELKAADGIAVRNDGVLVVVSQHKLYFVKSDSGWSEGVVFDETSLDPQRFASSVTVGGEDRVYVLYGPVDEGMMGNAVREEFAIIEIRSESESGEEAVWAFVLLGLGLAYFLFWRFQMRRLVTDMNKKTS